ncbi:hypothetical protein JL721_5159 [Aureococcus anophagefferens]|nr:hypothetical protein JL721_5159 [Aureococcus anophagefferens]
MSRTAVGRDAAEEEELTPQHTFVVEFYPGYRNKVKVTKSVMGSVVACPRRRTTARARGLPGRIISSVRRELGHEAVQRRERGPEAAQAMAHEDALVILGFKKVYEGQLERIADEEMRARVLAAHAELAARRTLRSPVKHGALRSAAPGLGPVRRRGDGYQVKVQRKGHDHWVDATDVDAINNASERAVAGFGSKHLSRLRNAETTKALDSGEVSFPEATNSWRRRESIGTVFRPDALANVDDVDDGDDECASASSPAGPGAALELAKQSAESRGDMAAVSPPRTRSAALTTWRRPSTTTPRTPRASSRPRRATPRSRRRTEKATRGTRRRCRRSTRSRRRSSPAA